MLLILLIERLSESMKSCDSLKVNLEFLKKQAKGMESEYLRVTKESSGASGSDDSAQGALEKALKTTIGDMRTALESLKVSFACPHQSLFCLLHLSLAELVQSYF